MADDLDDELFSLAAGRSKPPAKKRSRKAAAESDDGDAGASDGEDVPKRKRPAKGAAPPKRSVPRPPSEDEAGDDDDDGGGGGDEDDLYEDDEDRRKLMAMTELEREMILADRAEQRDKERQRKQLLQQQRTATEKVRVLGGIWVLVCGASPLRVGRWGGVGSGRPMPLCMQPVDRLSGRIPLSFLPGGGPRTAAADRLVRQGQRAEGA